MRNLQKSTKPQVLQDNDAQWLAEFLADSTNDTKKFRYRHPDIKTALKKETNDKCIYCESKIGHNTPGDIEHKIPSSKAPHSRFDWDNLTIACTECNRRKNDYYKTGAEFIDPYVENVEDILEHHGPVVLWQTGHARAEISVRKLELNSPERLPLFERKIGKLNELAHVLERYNSEQNPSLKTLLELQLKDMAECHSEYSAMVRSALLAKGII